MKVIQITIYFIAMIIFMVLVNLLGFVLGIGVGE